MIRTARRPDIMMRNALLLAVSLPLVACGAAGQSVAKKTDGVPTQVATQASDVPRAAVGPVTTSRGPWTNPTSGQTYPNLRGIMARTAVYNYLPDYLDVSVRYEGPQGCFVTMYDFVGDHLDLQPETRSPLLAVGALQSISMWSEVVGWSDPVSQEEPDGETTMILALTRRNTPQDQLDVIVVYATSERNYKLRMTASNPQDDACFGASVDLFQAVYGVNLWPLADQLLANMAAETI